MASCYRAGMARARARQTADIALLFGWNFAVVTAIFVGRTVRDALAADDGRELDAFTHCVSPWMPVASGAQPRPFDPARCRALGR